MTIRIRTTPYMNSRGTFPVHADLARTQLGIIAAGGTNDLPGSYGDHPDPADSNYQIVDYDPGPQDTSTPAGRVRQRLRTMVTESDSYEIIGIGTDFTWGDGATVQTNPAETLGNTVFYDTSNCGGDGRWIVGTNGNHECTQSAGMLYHELGGHAFLHQPPTEPTAQAEAEAIREENDLRVALGLVPRDENQIQGGCQCPGGCCIVASVATGSPFSPEVSALRELRDGTLRRSTIGAAFFEELHYEYYAFSYPVCRVMVRQPQARAAVELWLVRPLVQILTLARDYAASPRDVDRLGASFRATGNYAMEQWAEAEWFLNSLAGGSESADISRLESGTREICRLIGEWLPRSPHVQWAIIDPLRIYVSAGLRFGRVSDTREAGIWLAAAFDRWLGSIPLERVRQALAPSEIAADLPVLERILGSEEARRRIRERLQADSPVLSARRESMEHRTAVRVKHCRCAHDENKLRVTITLENAGERPAYAISEVRCLEFDPASGMLTLWLSDHQTASKSATPRRHHTQPRTHTIDAGAERSLELELPHRMTRIVTGENNSFDFEPLDLSKTRSVMARVAVHHTPFYFQPRKGDLRRQVAEWGKELEITQPVDPEDRALPSQSRPVPVE